MSEPYAKIHMWTQEARFYHRRDRGFVRLRHLLRSYEPPMLPVTLQGAFSRLTEALGTEPKLPEILQSRWAAGGRTSRSVVDLSAELVATIDLLEAELSMFTQST